MRFVRPVAAMALLSAVALCGAAPAAAEELTDGKYGVTRSGLPAPGNAPTMWTVTRCGAGCATIADGQGTIWDSRLDNGQWTARQHSETAVDCKNGHSAPGTSVFSLNGESLRGTIVSTSDGPACGSPQPITSGPVIIVMAKA